MSEHDKTPFGDPAAADCDVLLVATMGKDEPAKEPAKAADVATLMAAVEALRQQVEQLANAAGAVAGTRPTNGASAPGTGASPPETPKTPDRAPPTVPGRDYVTMAAAFVSAYLAIEPQRRRGIAHALPFVPAVIGTLDSVATYKRLDGRALVPAALPAAGGLAAVLLGGR